MRLVKRIGAWLLRLFSQRQRVIHLTVQQDVVEQDMEAIFQPPRHQSTQPQTMRVKQAVTGDRAIVIGNVEKKATVNITCGTVSVSPFVLPKQFFHRWLNKDRLFNHLWSLEGRIGTLEALKEFSDSSEMQTALLIGRGGIGKTKILREFSSIIEDTGIPIYFVEEGIDITLDSSSSLPSEECIVVMDDAHRRTEDIATLCRLIDIHAQTENPPIKLVLSLRPHALQMVEAELSRQGVRYRKLDEIKELGKAEREALAKQALGEQHSHLASSLASIAYDSPLVIVIGGQLIASQSIPVSLIGRQEDCRREIFNRFEDLVIGDISQEIDRVSCRRLLELLSAVVPARANDGTFLERASSFLEIDQVVLRQQLGLLEESGILIGRGNYLRITPDVLADHILYRACLTRNGNATGYSRKLFDSFRDICSSQIVYNLAELDWQLRLSGEQPSNQLVRDILEELEREFKDSSASGQYSLLEDVNKIAYHQPDYALGIVQFVMSRSAETAQPEKEVPLYDVRLEHLLKKLPRILRVISYHIDYVPICCDLLWRLGRNDSRKPRNNPPEAIVFLKELAAYDLYKPFSFNREVLNAALRWLWESDAHSYIYSTLDVLDPLLEREIEHRKFDGRSLSITHAPLAYRQVIEIREEVLQVIADFLDAEDYSIALRALKSLMRPLGKLRVPRFSQEELRAADQSWEPEQLKILEIINSFVSQKKEAVLVLKIASKLRTLSVRGSSLPIQQKAAQILSSIECTNQLKLTGVLTGNYDWDAEASQRKENWEEQHNALLKVKSEVVSIFVDVYPNYEKGLEVLAERLSAIAELGESINYGFFETLSKNYPVYALDICEAVLSKKSSPVAAYLHPLLYLGREAEPSRTAEIVKKAIASENALLCSSFASRYYGWDSFLCSDDLYTLASSLLNHSDPTIRRLALENLRCLTQFTPDIAIGLALAVETNSDSELLNYVFSVFESIGFEEIAEETTQVLLQRLESVDSLDEYHIQNFLNKAACKLPSDVIETIIKRIEIDNIDNDRANSVLPSNYSYKNCLSSLHKATEYPQLIEKIRDCWFAYASWLEKVPEEEYLSAIAQSKMRKERLYRSLYKQASLYRTEDKVVDVTAESIVLLEDWIRSGDQLKTIAVSKLISCFDFDFVFSHIDTICDLLNRSNDISEACYSAVYSNLWVISSISTGVSSIGEDPPEKIALRDRAREVTAQLYRGSPAHHFFESIAKQTESEIEHQRQMHEELYL